MRIHQELADRFKQGAFLLEDADSRRLRSALRHESAVRNQVGALPRHHQSTGLAREAGQVIPVGGAGYQQRIDFRVKKVCSQAVAASMQECLHKWNEETI